MRTEQHGIQNKSTLADQIFYVCHRLKKNMENTIKYIDFIECEKEHIMTFCKIAWGFDEKIWHLRIFEGFQLGT